MRVTFGTKFNQMQETQSSLQSKLSELNTTLASGKKIQHGYENSDVYAKDLQLGYQENTLKQGIDVAQNAYSMTLNTDKALGELSTSMEQFKIKLLQAGNQSISPTARNAIANELNALKQHMMNVANTSIGGTYLFGGTKIKTPPIAQDGTYKGNNQPLEALISSNTKVPFSITGQQLFLGQDSDHSKSITTNIKNYNLSKLHPAIMNQIQKDATPQEVFIKEDDTIRDLFGDNDDNSSNDQKLYFYLQGTRPDGSKFKSKFEIDPSFSSPNQAPKVRDLLNKIAQEYGNNHLNSAVEVNLNPWGEIEIKSLQEGSAKLDFNLIASTANVEDLTQLPSSGARTKSFQKSPYISSAYTSEITSVQDIFKPYQVALPVSFIDTQSNTLASQDTPLSQIFDSKVNAVVFDGGFAPKEEGENPPTLTIPTANATLYTLTKSLKDYYKQNGKEIEVTIAQGQIFLIDLSAKTQPTDLKLKVATLDSQQQPTKGIHLDYQTSHDGVFFQKSGASLLSNVSQLLSNGGGYASPATRLSEVVGDLTNQTYDLTLKDHNGTPANLQLKFESNGVFLVLPSNQPPSKDGTPQVHKIPVVDLNEKGEATLTTPQNMTYRQLMDTISLALNYSNQSQEVYAKLSTLSAKSGADLKELYERTMQQAQGKIEVKLNQNGQITITDRIRPKTQLEFAMSVQNDLDFSQKSLDSHRNSLSLHSNNALSIDQPQVDLFKMLDDAIFAVKEGIYRPDEFPNAYNEKMRSVGIQNSIQSITHLADHIEKMIALNGSYGKSLEASINKNEMLKTQVQSLRAENIGADIAETYNQFQNLSNNYNAALSSAGKISKMSILDYV